MLEQALVDRISSNISALKGRTHPAADLSEMIKRKALPQAPASCFVVPAGLRSQGGESAAGAVTAEIDEVIALVLVLRTAADVSGKSGLVKLDPLIIEILETVIGWAPGDDLADEAHPIVGVFRFLTGNLIKLDAGTIFYQLEIACAWQLRIPQ